MPTKPPPVLMYHSIGGIRSTLLSEAGAELYAVSVENFTAQMEMLSRMPGALITFDDGLLDNYTLAFPVLRRLKLKAAFFIIASRVEAKGYMNWEQLRELRDHGMLIGSHGVRHRLLTSLAPVELDYEVRYSKQMIQEYLGQTVDYFSVPRGFYDQRLIDACRKAGYTKVFTSASSDHDGFRIGRIAVRGSWGTEHLRKVISGEPPLKEKTGELARETAKKILGPSFYDQLRNFILRQ